MYPGTVLLSVGNLSPSSCLVPHPNTRAVAELSAFEVYISDVLVVNSELVLDSRYYLLLPRETGKCVEHRHYPWYLKLPSPDR